MSNKREIDGFLLTSTQLVEHEDGWGFRVVNNPTDEGVNLEYYQEETDGVSTVVWDVMIWGAGIRLLGEALIKKADEMGVPK